jgi:hypothetical protein
MENTVRIFPSGESVVGDARFEHVSAIVSERDLEFLGFREAALPRRHWPGCMSSIAIRSPCALPAAEAARTTTSKAKGRRIGAVFLSEGCAQRGPKFGENAV